jgi:hypothetical protein
MREFLRRMNVTDGTLILDLGGQPEIWDMVERPLDITILNLPGQTRRAADGPHRFHFVEGDACDVAVFEAGKFDVVFSNSVIEHVGAEDRQAAFSAEVHRLGASYWIQTPSKWFPVEAHCGMPFWWFYPGWLRRVILSRWQEKLPAWTDMVRNTRVLTKRRLRALFPEAEIWVERSLGFPKSYTAYLRACRELPDAPLGRKR